MSVALRRAVVLGCFAAVIAAPHFAGAQSSDYSGDYSRDYPGSISGSYSGDYSQDYAREDSGDDTQDSMSDAFASAAALSAPVANDVTLGVPSQAIVLAQAPAGSSAPAEGVAVRFIALDNRFDVHADGSSTVTSHVELQLISPQAVAALAEPALSYSDSLQDLQIRNAYTLKKDGTRIPVAPEAILVRQKAMPTPLFSDLKEKVILFPNVEPGDTLVYDTVIQSQARIGGQFYFGSFIPRTIEVDNETITFSAPRSLPLSFESYGLAVQKAAEGDNLIYTIHYANRAPVFEQTQFLSEFDYGQRLFASSIGSFDAMAAGYAPMVSDKIVVTPKILAKANEITAGVSDRRERARKLYDWVSLHVRYIALMFGDGGIVPHAADTTLANAYGDCKDHAVLYSALLKAKGIAGDPVIINGSNGYFMPQIPQLLTFNHMIVFLPEFGLYADTTSNTTPFGALPQFEYGKPVIRIGGAGGALQHTPVLSEAGSTYSSSSALKLDSAGKLSGTHAATSSGALSGVLRGVADQAIAQGSGFVNAILQARKLDAASGSMWFAPTGDLTPQYNYKTNFQFGRPLQSDAGFVPPEGLNLVDAYSAALFGPVAESQFANSDSLPCFSGRLVDDYTLEFPADKRLVALPPDGQVLSANIDFRSHWSLNGNVVSVHRELHAHFDTALCTGDVLRDTRAAIVRIRKDYLTRIAIAAPHAS